MASTQLIYVGINGHVLALDRTTGAERWRTRLKRSTFVHLVGDDRRLYATAAGELFCLDAVSGSILWQNPLKGMGLGLTSIVAPDVGATGSADLLVAQSEARRRKSAEAG